MTKPTEEEYLAALMHAHRKAKLAEADAMRAEKRMLTILLARYRRGEVVSGLFGSERKP